MRLELQPLLAGVRRVVEAMAYLGEPLPGADRAELEAAAGLGDESRAVAEIQRILDPRCLLAIRINPESRVSVERGAAAPRLLEQGWRAYLMKVRNEAGVTAALGVESPQARPVYHPGTGLPMAPASVLPADIRDRPIRASRRSVEWCLKGFDQCWAQKSRGMRPREREAGQRAYDHARMRYRQILTETEVETRGT